jgi:putative redox protein
VSDIHVEHVRGDQFLVKVGGHSVLVDQPEEAGGEDRGPTPTELWVAGLAACVAFYAGRFLRRHGVDASTLAVDTDFAMSEERPARVMAISIAVRVPDGVSAERRRALQRVVEHCTVHNSMADPPEVRIELDARSEAA